MPKLRKPDAESRIPDPTLKRLLRGFLTNPVEPDTVYAWYDTLAERCPHWALQFMPYLLRYARRGAEAPRLFDDLPLELMARPTRDRTALRKFLRVEPPASVFESGPKEWVFQVPPDAVRGSTTLKRFAPRYLLQSYRFALMSHEGGPKRLASLWRELSQLQQEYAGEVPVAFMQPPNDYPDFDRRTLSDRLRDLVIARDTLPAGRQRDEADTQVKDFLKETGVLRTAGGKASLPRAKKLVKSLAEKACDWLAVLQAVHDTAISTGAAEGLASWGCEDSERWSRRLALPFLNEQELDYVVQGSAEDRELTAAYLIHRRLQGILALRTVADHAFGAEFVRDGKSALSTNPFTR